MKLTIDNLDDRGPREYTAYLVQKPRVVRSLNKPATLRLELVSSGPDFVVPVNGAHVMLGRLNGQDEFNGFVSAPPTFEYLGWGGYGPVYRYIVLAEAYEKSLDHKTIRRRFPFVARSAGNALRQLVEDLLPGSFDTSRVQDLDVLPSYSCDPQKTWSEHAAEIALRARGSYRVTNGQVIFEAIGTNRYSLSEADKNFSPEGLTLTAQDALINDITVVGMIEPQAHVKDYFVGDGYSMKFYLSQVPFMSSNRTMLDEEYARLDPTRWIENDPAGAIAVTAGKLLVTGGTNTDGETRLTFTDKIELGGTLFLQHGDVRFDGPSRGMLGGLYTDRVASASCFAGFDVSAFGSQSRIQARINGSLTGPSMSTLAGHHYVLTTRLYGSEVYRLQQVFHSSTHAAGAARGGASVRADVRAVLEVHDIDPSNPGSQVAASTILFDGILANAPEFCIYALVNAMDLHCNLTFTRITRAVNAEVRSALPGEGYRTLLAGSLSDGAECKLSREPALQFFPQSMPAPNELISVHYRGSGRALARVSDSASITAHARGNDDGVRAVVRSMHAPAARNAQDCELAALAILDDATGPAWSGEYKVWSDFLPGAAVDIFPGDALDVNVPSRGAIFRAIVREVEIECVDLGDDHCLYTIRFCDEAAEALSMAFTAGPISDALDLAASEPNDVGSNFLADLTAAEIVLPPGSRSVTLDAGIDPTPGGGIEVRWSDSGWGGDNDRNLIGRFNLRSFSVPRLGRVQDFFLRQYDQSSPARYSRYSAALHLDYPL